MRGIVMLGCALAIGAVGAADSRSIRSRRVYVDGTCLRELELTGFGIATAGETLMMGQKVASDSPEQWSGAIDDVRIYNRALDGAEVEELLHEGGR